MGSIGSSVWSAARAWPLWLCGALSLACFAPAPYQRAPTTPNYRPQAYQPQAVQAPEGPKPCSSDFSCSYGQKCVKQQFQLEGVCADVVNGYGVKTYNYAPQSDSVGIGNPSQCQFDTDCGPGWHCIKGTGIYGTCMR